MIDFHKIILTTLNESSLASSLPNSIFKRALDKSGQFFREYSKMGYAQYTEEAASNILTLMHRTWVRQSDKNWLPHSRFFMLIDFFAYSYEVEVNDIKKSPDLAFFGKEIAEDDYTTLVTNFFQAVGRQYIDPLRNNTASSFAGLLKIAIDKAAAFTLGREVLNKPEFQKMSVLRAVFAFIHARKLKRETTLNLSNIPEPNEDIKKILIDGSASGGLTTVPQALFKYYKENFLKDLQLIGYHAKKLWEQQKELYNAEKTPNTFAQFLDNVPLTPFDNEIVHESVLIQPFQLKEATAPSAYEAAYEAAIKRANLTIGNIRNTNSFDQAMYGDTVSSKAASSTTPSPVDSSKAAISNPSPLPNEKGKLYNFKVPVQSDVNKTGFINANKPNNPGIGGYTISNIEHMASTNPAAESLMNALYQFADYVHEGEPSNKISNLTNTLQNVGKIAKALSFGMD